MVFVIAYLVGKFVFAILTLLQFGQESKWFRAIGRSVKLEPHLVTLITGTQCDGL